MQSETKKKFVIKGLKSTSLLGTMMCPSLQSLQRDQAPQERASALSIILRSDAIMVAVRVFARHRAAHGDILLQVAQSSQMASNSVHGTS